MVPYSEFEYSGHTLHTHTHYRGKHVCVPTYRVCVSVCTVSVTGPLQWVQLVDGLILVGPLQVQLDLLHQGDAEGLRYVQLLRLAHTILLPTHPSGYSHRTPANTPLRLLTPYSCQHTPQVTHTVLLPTHPSV